MEKEANNKRDSDVINAELFGNDIKEDYIREDVWKLGFEELYKNAKTNEDLSALGAKLNYAIDNKLNVNTIDYQFKAAKKATEIDKGLENEVKQ